MSYQLDINEFNFKERLLLKFCLEPIASDSMNDHNWNLSNALDLYKQKFSDFENLISNKTILDIGCGQGIQCLALLKENIKKVVGVDTNPIVLSIANKNLNEYVSKESLKITEKNADKITENITDKISFLDQLPVEKFDLVLSQNSFEHYDDPKQMLDLMYKSLKIGGKALISFGPLWNSPYGAHFNFITNLPWVHKIYSEASLMKIRALYRDDGALSFSEIPGGMNQLSLWEFEKVFKESNFHIEYKKCDTVRNLPFARIPFLREFFVNHLTYLLSKE